MEEENMEEEKFLSKQERRHLRKEEEKKADDRRNKAGKRKKILKFVGWTIVVIALLVGVFALLGLQKNLPPTSFLNHIEVSPPSHIVTEPMDYRIHKHMLEHADGGGPPGIIINYNCEDFECESDLIDKLEEIVRDFPANVYLAPWSGMSERLVITRESRQKVLVGFNEQEIRDFINR